MTGIQIAKNFRQESALYDHFVGINNLSYRVNLRRGFVLANVFPTLNALAGVGTSILVYFGGMAAASGARPRVADDARQEGCHEEQDQGESRPGRLGGSHLALRL